MARSRVKSRRNRRPSKARTRRVSKRRMRRVSKRRMRRTSKRRTGRISKRRRRFQRGGMEFNPRKAIRGLEPEPTSPFLNIHTIGGLPAVSVDKFDPLADQSPERYQRLLTQRAYDYATSLERTIQRQIEKLKSDIEKKREVYPSAVRNIQATIDIGEEYLKVSSPLFGIDDQIEFEFVDVTINPNPTFSLREGTLHEKKTSGGDLVSYYSGRNPPPCFEIIVMINPLQYIVIRGTYDEILKLYPLSNSLKRSRRFKTRGGVETQSQTIFDNIKEYWRNGLIRVNTHIGDHPLKSLAETINVGDLKGRPRDLLPPQIIWGRGTSQYGMNEEAVRDYQYYNKETEYLG